LFEQSMGRVGWVIETGKVNAYRPAAADAVAADVLARPDASLPALFGTANRALFECAAISQVRPITRLLIVAVQRRDAFAARLQAEGFDDASAHSSRHAAERLHRAAWRGRSCRRRVKAGVAMPVIRRK